MGVFGGIKDAKYSEGGNYLQPGVFRLKVDKVKHFKTRTGKEAFCAEFNVMESTNQKHLPGSQVTWMVTMDKEPALGNIKQFISSVLEADINQVDEAVAELVISEKQPLTGKVVRASAVEITTKAGRPFTKVKFLADSAGHDAAAAEQSA